MKDIAVEYITLLENLISGQICAPEFQILYLTKVKDENRKFGDELFDIIEELFGDTDVFVADEELYKGLSQERPNWYLNESQFRVRAAIALDKLKTYVMTHLPESAS